MSQSESGKLDVSSDKDLYEIEDLQKRYRLHGKRSNEEETDQEEETGNDLEKRYRLYGKRLTDSDAAELEKRYRLYGKRYRLYGKRYRLYGKREESNESDDSNEYSRLMKRYRLAGNGTFKRYRLMGK